MIVRLGPTASEQNKFESPYIRACFDGSLEYVKEPERRKVYDFIDRHRPKNLKLLSLPGIGWKFERTIADADPKAEFVAVERLDEVVRAGVLFMPGQKTRRLEEDVGDIRYYGVRTSRARWFRAELSGFLSFFVGDARKKERKAWACRYKRVSAVWLDFTSPLCREVAFCLPHIGNVTGYSEKCIPVVITMMMGREPGSIGEELDRVNADPLTKRVAAVSALINSGYWRDFEVTDAWTYQSSVTMLTITGLSRLRAEPRMGPRDIRRISIGGQKLVAS